MHFNYPNTEQLIRDSERLAVVTEYVEKTEKVNILDLKILLGLEEEKKINGNSKTRKP